MNHTNWDSNFTLDDSRRGDGDVLHLLLLLQTVLFAAVCFLGLVGNTLVIYVVVRYSKMQTVTNMYIVNLAIADECFLIGIPFLIVTMVNGQWILGGTACKVYMISTSINQFTSSIFLFIMSADRYIAVCHPISSPKWRTPIISRVVSLLAWTCSILLIIPIIRHATEIREHNKTSCVIEWSTAALAASGNETANASLTGGQVQQDAAAQSAMIFTIYTFVFSFAIPLSLILVFYCLVIQKLRTVGPKNKSKEKKKSHRKVTNLVLTVVTVYVICWLPYWITQLANLFYPSTSSTSNFVITLHLLASCFSYSNSAMNPILYAFLSDNFKKSFLKACTCAAGKEVNATLHLENSVFPRGKQRQGGSERTHHHRQGTLRGGTTTTTGGGEELAAALIGSGGNGEASTSVITMTSVRSPLCLQEAAGVCVLRNGNPGVISFGGGGGGGAGGGGAGGGGAGGSGAGAAGGVSGGIGNAPTSL